MLNQLLGVSRTFEEQLHYSCQQLELDLRRLILVSYWAFKLAVNTVFRDDILQILKFSFLPLPVHFHHGNPLGRSPAVHQHCRYARRTRLRSIPEEKKMVFGSVCS